MASKKKTKGCRYKKTRLRRGQLVVTDAGGIGKLDGIVGPMANVTLDLGEPFGVTLTEIVPQDTLLAANTWERKLHRTFVRQLQAAYNRGYARGVQSGLGKRLAHEQNAASEDEALEVVRQVLKGDRR